MPFPTRRGEWLAAQPGRRVPQVTGLSADLSMMGAEKQGASSAARAAAPVAGADTGPSTR